jgi:hypothetical protein
MRNLTWPTFTLAAMLAPITATAAEDADLAPPQIKFTTIGGEANGSGEILTRRKAEILERRGGKLQSHDWWLWGLSQIDYDRDGDPDFVMSIHGPNNGIIMRSEFRETGKLTLVDVTKELGVDGIVPSASSRKTIAWDFDDDGWLDLIGVGGPHLINQGGKKFMPSGKQVFIAMGAQAIVDLNGDGYLDVKNEHGRNGIYDPTTKTFTIENFVDPAEAKFAESVHADWSSRGGKDKNRFFRYRYLTDHDLDGDGRNDIIVAGYASYGGDAIGRYFLTDAAGQPVEAAEKLGLPTTGTPMLITDLTGDGRPEVLIAADAAGGLFVNDGSGRFRRASGPASDMLATRDPYLHLADVVDLDNDSDLDLVLAKPRGGPKSIFENQGQGKFALVHSQRGWDADPVSVCDLNGDGRMDVAIGGPGDQVTFLVNDTPGGNFCDLLLDMPAPNKSAVGAKVEVFEAGTLAKPNSRPLYTLTAQPEGTGVHLGLGARKQIDLRVTFPAPKSKAIELVNQDVHPRMKLDSGGRMEVLK